MAVDFSVEYPIIRTICGQRGLDPLFLCAIRVAENGARGREFGVLSVEANDYDSQLRVCTRTIAGYLDDFEGNPFVLTEANGLHRVVYREAFVLYCAERYAPIGAGNDPARLNANWRPNVSRLYATFVQLGYPLYPI